MKTVYEIIQRNGYGNYTDERLFEAELLILCSKHSMDYSIVQRKDEWDE